MADKSKILIIGGTGYIGKFIVEESVKSGHPTFVLVRQSTISDPDKSKLIDNFKSHGVNIVYGDIYDHESLVNVVKQVDVVISTVGAPQVADQVNIIAAIKEAGNIKRFLPSEFGIDVDRVHAIEPAASLFFGEKAKLRRIIESEGIPYTFVVANGFAGYFLANLGQTGAKVPPRDKVVILGNGNPKAIYLKEEDIATYTIKAVDDPRTLNKNLYMNPPGDVFSHNELVSMWEKKIGKTLEKTYLSEEQMLEKIRRPETPESEKMLLSIFYSVFIKGDNTNFEIDPSFGVETAKLYPEVKYTPIDEYLNQFV